MRRYDEQTASCLLLQLHAVVGSCEGQWQPDYELFGPSKPDKLQFRSTERGFIGFDFEFIGVEKRIESRRTMQSDGIGGMDFGDG